MASTKDWLHAFRLRTLPLSISGILVGSFFAFHNDFRNWPVFALALVTTLLFQVLSNLANDLGDSQKGADNAGRIGPQRAVQSGAISMQQMKRAVSVNASLSLVAATGLIVVGSDNLGTEIRWFYIGLAVACILAAITYTIGKRAYGYHGFGDLFVFIFFGCVSVAGVYPLFAGQLSAEIVLPAFTIGAFSTAVLNLNNMRDIENDAKAGKNTLVVKIGYANAKRYHYSLILFGFACWVLFLVRTEQWLGFISILPFILLLKHMATVSKTTENRALDPELKKVALSTFFLSVLYMISVLFDKLV